MFFCKGVVLVNIWSWLIIIALAYWGLVETISRGFDSVTRQQREMNRNLIRIAKQLGYEFEEDPLQNDVLQLLQDGHKIKAIKLVRTHHKLSLKEAKSYVDEIESARKL